MLTDYAKSKISNSREEVNECWQYFQVIHQVFFKFLMDIPYLQKRLTDI